MEHLLPKDYSTYFSALLRNTTTSLVSHLNADSSSSSSLSFWALPYNIFNYFYALISAYTPAWLHNLYALISAPTPAWIRNLYTSPILWLNEHAFGTPFPTSSSSSSSSTPHHTVDIRDTPGRSHASTSTFLNIWNLYLEKFEDPTTTSDSTHISWAGKTFTSDSEITGQYSPWLITLIRTGFKLLVFYAQCLAIIAVVCLLVSGIEKLRKRGGRGVVGKVRGSVDAGVQGVRKAWHEERIPGSPVLRNVVRSVREGVGEVRSGRAFGHSDSGVGSTETVEGEEQGSGSGTTGERSAAGVTQATTGSARTGETLSASERAKERQRGREEVIDVVANDQKKGEAVLSIMVDDVRDTCCAM